MSNIIQIASFTWGTNAGFNLGQGKPQVSLPSTSFVNIVRGVDQTSVMVLQNLNRGQSTQNLVISEIINQGLTSQLLATYTFSNIWVTSESIAAFDNDVDRPVENLTFAFTTYKYQYYTYNADGNPLATYTTCYDFVKNAVC